jgi:phosphoglycolate phosphatase
VCLVGVWDTLGVRVDALVFDLDGTLWDTCETCAIAWNAVVARLGIAYRTMTAADVRAVAGRPHLDAIRAAFPGLGEGDVVRLTEATAVADNEAIARDGGAVYPGVREHVPALARRVPLLIVSNCQRGYVETFLGWSGLGAHFADFECWGNTGRTKAENLGAIVARNRLRAPFFIGDTEGDRSAAEANGVPFVHVTWGFGDVARPDFRVDRFEEIARLV